MSIPNQSDDLAPDTPTIRNFLKSAIANNLHLAAIVPDGALVGRYFGDDVEAAVKWAVDLNLAGRNIHYTANQCHAGVTAKPSKEDIRKARRAHVDIDPPKDGSALDKQEVIRALEDLPIPPTDIVDSGNGIQASWKLKGGVDDPDRVEAINKAIAQRLGGDSGHNIDRLLRVPGTVNYPNAAKRKRGCVAVMSTLVSSHPERANTPDELEKTFPLTDPITSQARASAIVPEGLALLSSVDLTRGDTAKLTMMLDEPDTHFRNSDRSAWVYGIACQMADDGYSDDEVLGVLLNTNNAGCAHIGDQKDPARAASRALSKAKSRWIPAGGSIFGNNPSKSSNKPTITVLPGHLPEVVDQGEQALIHSSLGYYQVSGRIVRAGEMSTKTATGESEDRLRIVTVCHAELIEALTKAAEWLKPSKTGAVTIDCPAAVAETLLARTGRLRLPPLTGIIDVPTLRSDGSVLWRAGYDRITGLLLMPGDTKVPKLPQSPTRDDAIAALRVLQKLIAGFPFVTDADKSVALSALLTSTIRTALRTAPAHGYTAPTAGSGKSTLVDLASVLRTGRPAAPISQGRNNEELEKRLGALLMEGEGLIAIDNCETALGGDILCQLLTQQNIKVRVLGQSTMVEVPTSALVTATGNNLSFLGDMSRRALLCQLDPGVERPELRQFAFDPVKLAKEQRADFVTAALTILRAYHVAGRPQQVAPLGSFADWSNWVRSSLIWLGCADPCDTMEKVRKADPQMALIKQVMAQWKKVIGQNKVTTGDLNAKAEEMEETPAGSNNKKHKHPEFRDALLAIAGEGARINGRRLGRWLSKHEGRVVGGHKFSNPSVRGGQSVWVLEQLAEPPSGTPAAGD